MVASDLKGSTFVFEVVEPILQEMEAKPLQRQTSQNEL